MPCKKTGSLQNHLQPALNALSKADRNRLNFGSATNIECSANIDAALQPTEPNANRWDYFVCVRAKKRHRPIYIEVHEVSADHVDILIRKRDWLVGAIATGSWPRDDEMPFLVAGKNLLPPTSLDQKRLALAGLVHISKGDAISDFL